MDKDDMMEQLEEEKALLADGFDDCIIGVQAQCGHNIKAIYSAQAIISKLAKDMTEEQALEYYEFNICGAYIENGPIFMEIGIKPNLNCLL